MGTIDQTPTTPTHVAAPVAGGAWRLDAARSSVECDVRHFYGLMAVEGEFADYDGTLNLSAEPAFELTIRGASLNTKMANRDEHLRSGGFFDVPSKLIVRGRLVRR
jgi:polyisoprenoid-binding protein YceI